MSGLSGEPVKTNHNETGVHQPAAPVSPKTQDQILAEGRARYDLPEDGTDKVQHLQRSASESSRPSIGSEPKSDLDLMREEQQKLKSGEYGFGGMEYGTQKRNMELRVLAKFEELSKNGKNILDTGFLDSVRDTIARDNQDFLNRRNSLVERGDGYLYLSDRKIETKPMNTKSSLGSAAAGAVIGNVGLAAFAGISLTAVPLASAALLIAAPAAIGVGIAYGINRFKRMMDIRKLKKDAEREERIATTPHYGGLNRFLLESLKKLGDRRSAEEESWYSDNRIVG